MIQKQNVHVGCTVFGISQVTTRFGTIQGYIFPAFGPTNGIRVFFSGIAGETLPSPCYPGYHGGSSGSHGEGVLLGIQLHTNASMEKTCAMMPPRATVAGPPAWVSPISALASVTSSVTLRINNGQLIWDQWDQSTR